MKTPTSRELTIRSLCCHCNCWGREGAPLLVMLHGWGDAGASFQFVVDALAREWFVVAPDWRGFGRSEWAPGGYWFPDYLADLDALLAQLSPEAPARLVGHSMGGNVACLYAGVRPQRVAALVALDSFGLRDRAAEEAPGRYALWLREQATAAQWKSYDDFDALAARLQAQNPRLDADKAAYLARVLGRQTGDGRVTLAADPAHRRVNPVLYRRAEAEACWRRVRAPVLWVEPGDARLRERLGLGEEEAAVAKACFADLREHSIAEAGHNLHHDAPQAVARLIEDFLS